MATNFSKATEEEALGLPLVAPHIYLDDTLAHIQPFRWDNLIIHESAARVSQNLAKVTSGRPSVFASPDVELPLNVLSLAGVHEFFRSMREAEQRGRLEIERLQGVENEVRERLSFLEAEALDDSEPFDKMSAEHLTSFCTSHAISRAPAIFLLPNGNLRALWADPDRRSQIGIQFLPNGRLQFVIFREDDAGRLQDLGTETPAAVRGIVGLLHLTRLWSHG